MNKLLVRLGAVGTLLCAAGCATTMTEDQVEALVAAQTPETFDQTSIVKNDSLDTIATVSTEPGYQHRKGLLGVVWDDNFLRGFIDKKSGKTTIQVYQRITYEGDWRYYRTVNYETPDGPVSTPVLSISRDVVTCAGSRYSGCTLSESFAFEVDETLLRTIAERYEPGAMAAWRFKYGAQAAEDWQDGLLPAEVVGFLRALDRTRETLNSSNPAA